MKKLFLLFILIISAFSGYSQSCPNGNAEYGNFTGWQAWTGYNPINNNGVLNLSTFTPGFVASRHAVMTPGADPIIGSGLPKVQQGNYAFRLGDTSANTQAQILSFTFTVTSGNKFFPFSYAMVLQSAHATASQNAFFSYWISKSGTLNGSDAAPNLIPGTLQKFMGDTTNPFFSVMSHWGGPVAYKVWQQQCMDLSNYVGQTLTIYFATAGCNQGTHFGYAYIDAVCSEPPLFTIAPYICRYDQIIADGSAAQNTTDHYWQIEQLSSNNPSSVVPGTTRTQYNYNVPVGIINLYNLYTTQGGVLASGYYLVTLGVKRCDGAWETLKKVIEVRLPELHATDQFWCCDEKPQLNAYAPLNGKGGKDVGTFAWYDANHNFLGNGSNSIQLGPLGNPDGVYNTIPLSVSTSGKYLVVYTDPNGCTNAVWVYGIFLPLDFTVRIDKEECWPDSRRLPCGLRKLRAVFEYRKGCNQHETFISRDDSTILSLIRSQLTYQWSTGETTQDIPMLTGVTSYSVTISNKCASQTASISASEYELTGPFSQPAPNNSGNSSTYPGMLHFTNGPIEPGGSYTYQPFQVIQMGTPFGQPAYNAYQYKLYIFNRWGQQIYQYLSPIANCGGLKNGDILWDLKDQSGNYVPLEDYTFELWLYNCDHQSNTPLFMSGLFTVIH